MSVQDDWYRRAELALTKGDEELAREALSRKKANQVPTVAAVAAAHGVYGCLGLYSGFYGMGWAGLPSYYTVPCSVTLFLGRTGRRMTSLACHKHQVAPLTRLWWSAGQRQHPAVAARAAGQGGGGHHHQHEDPGGQAGRCARPACQSPLGGHSPAACGPAASAAAGGAGRSCLCRLACMGGQVEQLGLSCRLYMP
jgi:hypothetical protein